jgi:hypothetical protein
MKAVFGLLLVFLGVLLNNVVYLQDLILGQGYISLDGWRAFAGLGVSLMLIFFGCVLLVFRSGHR